ncbi:hypothetical protein SVAN01_10783 [Stagonosporopsis vannaccii]|nr:hypothetical protein SVAN01_10783 [Stagonosporopsis vannaccii]
MDGTNVGWDVQAGPAARKCIAATAEGVVGDKTRDSTQAHKTRGSTQTALQLGLQGTAACGRTEVQRRAEAEGEMDCGWWAFAAGGGSWTHARCDGSVAAGGSAAVVECECGASAADDRQASEAARLSGAANATTGAGSGRRLEQHTRARRGQDRGEGEGARRVQAAGNRQQVQRPTARAECSVVVMRGVERFRGRVVGDELWLNLGQCGALTDPRGAEDAAVPGQLVSAFKWARREIAGGAEGASRSAATTDEEQASILAPKLTNDVLGASPNQTSLHEATACAGTPHCNPAMTAAHGHDCPVFSRSLTGSVQRRHSSRFCDDERGHALPCCQVLRAKIMDTP